jgi:putative ABC transport system permease protein
VGDFYPNTISSLLRPAIIRLISPDQYRYAVIRTTPEGRQEVNAYLEDYWRQNYSNLAYGGLWLDWNTRREYEVNDNIRLVFLYVAVIAIVISSMGLLALVSLNIARRTREIGIRKALGASVANIGALVTREFVILILIGSVLAVGLGYYLTDLFLSSIWSYYCDFGASPFVASILIILAVAALSVGYRVWTAARSNPVEALRYE